MNTQLAAVTVLTLRHMDNDTLAAANNALTGFGALSKTNIAFNAMREVELIRDDGKPNDSETLLAALSLVINERVDQGKFSPVTRQAKV